MDVVVHHGGNSVTEAEAVAEIVRGMGRRAEIIPADLRVPAQIDALFAEIRARYGRLDVLVNNAASFNRVPFAQMALDHWNETLATNLTAPFLVSQAAAPLMRGEGGSLSTEGAIINVVDMGAFRPWPNYMAHVVSKAGLKSLSDALALELAPKIRVNAVALGVILRDEGTSPERWQQIGEGLPMGRTGDPEDVAQAVIYLAQQPFVTGTTLIIDGGESLQA
jgi:pteridine reductase